MVRSKDHQAYHKLFGNMLAEEVAAMLTDTWIDSNVYFVAVPRKKKVSKRRNRMYCTDCECEVLRYVQPVSMKGKEDG